MTVEPRIQNKRKCQREFRGVDAQGVLDSRVLPDDDFSHQWDAIIVDTELKDRLPDLLPGRGATS